jgi:4-hydroxy-2-oxoheptanedioate aldolase
MEKTIKLRQLLSQGRIALGTAVDTFSPAAVEVVGYCGLDFVRLDMEYSWRRDESLEHMIRAATIAGLTAMVRVEKGQPYLISKVLQAGAGAVLVCDITGYEEAADVVRAARFAPKGARGYNPFTVTGRWGFEGGKGWSDWCDSQLMVGIMVENQEVIKELDRICALEGLDYLLFGPADYSMSLGLREPKKNDPRVQDAVKRTCEVAAKHSKWVCMGIGEPWAQEAEHYTKMGVKMLELSHDVTVLANGFKRAIGEIRK